MIGRVVFATSVLCVFLISLGAPIFGWWGFLFLPSFIGLAVFMLYRWTVRYDGRDEERAATVGWWVAIPLHTNNRWLVIMSVLTIVSFGLWVSTDSGPPPLAAQAQYELELARAETFGTPVTMTDPSQFDMIPWNVRRFCFWAMFLSNLVYLVVALSDEVATGGRWIRRVMRSDSVEGQQPWWQRLISSFFPKKPPNPTVYVGGAPQVNGQAASVLGPGQNQILNEVASNVSIPRQVGVEFASNLAYDASKDALKDLGKFMVSLFKKRR